MHFAWNITKVYSLGSERQNIRIGSYDGLVLNKQGIARNNDKPVHRRKYE